MISHTMMIWVRVIDRRLRDETRIGEGTGWCHSGQMDT